MPPTAGTLAAGPCTGPLQPVAWWREAVFYQVYIRSFADGNGDGVGDLAGIRSRLPYLAGLGVQALWITPFYPSPMADHGYDVADPRDVEPVFGDLAEFDAHARRGARPRHPGDHRSRPQPQLARPRVVPGGAGRRPGLARPGPLHLPRRPRARRQRTAEQLALGVRRPGLDAGARRPVVPAPVRPRAARPAISPTPRSSPTSSRPCGSGSTAASTVSASTWPTAWPSPTGCPTWCRWRTPGCSPDTGPATTASTRTACTSCTGGSGRSSTSYPGPDGRRRGVGRRRRAAGAVRARRRTAPRVQLQAAARGLVARGRARRDRRLAGHGRRHTGPGLLGAVQPRPATARHPLRRRGAGRAAGPRRSPAAAGPAGRGLPLQRRRAGPAQRRRPARRGAAGPGLGALRRTRADGTAAGCRCRGRATGRRTASRRRRTPGCPCRRTGPR